MKLIHILNFVLESPAASPFIINLVPESIS